MTIITRRLKVTGNKQIEEEFEALFDSGSSRSFLSSESAERICTIDIFDKPEPIILGDGKTTVNAIGSCWFIADLDGCIIRDDAWVLEYCSTDMIIGARTLENYNIKLDFENDTVDLSSCKSMNILV
ncbi:MAG TPA: hypothetical protein VKK79_21600 [Candidatus Lokiarchaeia archaeon]|nr:hypothetical protein [Candidatus Lokiarchaeia archaeon]